DITKKGNYIISFQNNGSGFDEFLLLECRLNSVVPDGIMKVLEEDGDADISKAKFYNASGVQIPNMQKGMNIIVYPNGKTRKIIIR
ncbi:MAG: hypothetical protein II398_06115, partial [Prevotella sp.]|nr:hypothetical protein [Prevotella sp.]